MPFSIIPIITAIPSIITAYKTVKDINKEPTKTVNKHLTDIGHTNLKDHEVSALSDPSLNLLKRQTAIALLKETKVWKWLQKRGCDEDDLGTIVDFACVICKIVRGKK